METKNTGIKPIGEVKNDIKEPMRHGWGEVVSDIILDTDMEEALEGLEEFSHIIVFFWLHKIHPDREISKKIHPRGRQDLPLVGLFATRSPHRPNPMGMSVVKLLECRGNVLKVEGLDAIDGTPVIDIKPYLPRDRVADITYPEWVSKM